MPGAALRLYLSTVQDSFPEELEAPAIVCGLISGTSADGVDAVCGRFDSEEPPAGAVWETLGSAVVPYPAEVAEALRDPESLRAPDLARLHVVVGRIFAQAAAKSIDAAGVQPDDVALIGSHGQTVWHDPEGTLGGVPATLQIGEPAEIAALTGRPVWSDFRTADVAAGGQGAPFVPYVDWLLFSDPSVWTVCLNLGGIANITLLPPAACLDAVLAFDTGPANIVLDTLARRLLGEECDEGGMEAQAGEVDPERLSCALDDPYFARPAPKSTGREAFGAAFVERHFGPLEGLSALERHERFATAAALTVESVALAIEGGCGTPVVPDDGVVLVSGGGRKNRVLMEGLASRCAPRRVLAVDERGIDGDLKEAIAFAILGYESARGRSVNVPSATGARRAVRCGRLTPPPS